MIKQHFFIVFITFLAILNISFKPTPSQAKRAIPSNNLAYPVLIAFPDNSSGTAFYLRSDKHLYLVTAKHVLFKNLQSELRVNTAICLSYPEDINEVDPIRIFVDVNGLNSQGLIKCHQTHDVVIVQIGNIEKKSEESGSVNFNKGVVRQATKKIISSLVIADVNGTKAFDDVLISNDIFIFGYPTSLGMPNDPQFEIIRPLLRKGIIAGKNLKRETIIIDCPAYYGNSGGPVIEVDNISLTENKYLLIGVLSQFIPYTKTWENKTNKLSRLDVSNSGYSVVTPIDKVLELITQFEKPAEPNSKSESGKRPTSNSK
jgi:hypothetical protein